MSLQSQNPYHRGNAPSSRLQPGGLAFASPSTIRDGFDFIDDGAAKEDEDGTDSELTCRLMMTGLPLEQISERDVAVRPFIQRFLVSLDG